MSDQLIVGKSVIVMSYPDNGVLKARNETAKIMAIADGYAMLRKPRATPFVRSIKELEKLNA